VIASVVQAAIEELSLREIRFDDLVQWVRLVEPDADVCEIDKAARPFETGAPGAYGYVAERQRVLPGMEE
jgi:hypothetical protein